MKKTCLLMIAVFMLCLTTRVLAAPAAPTMTYETNGLNITVSWTEVPDATGYTLYYAAYPYVNGDIIGSLDRGTETSYSIDLWEGAAYYIAVRARNGSGESDYSNIEQFTITTHVPPEAPRLDYNLDGTTISMTWDLVPTATGYILRYAIGGYSDPETFTPVDVGDHASFTYADLQIGESYAIALQAYNAYGVSAYSNIETFELTETSTFDPDDIDDDSDGYTENEGDCDDADPSINPGATEVCGDGIDQDCSGSDFTCTTPFTVTSPTGRVWMDRNLGASQVATAYNDSAAYGDLYQWGRGADGHEKRTSPTTTTLSSSDTPGHGSFITSGSSSSYDWRSPQNDNLWQGVSGVNNPCPSGFRLPTIAEWESERVTWSSNDRNGAFASPLSLVSAEYRYYFDGSIDDAGSFGYYWSSSVNGSFARSLYFGSGYADVYDLDYRADGFSVRCLED